jgi:hypothetical protein
MPCADRRVEQSNKQVAAICFIVVKLKKVGHMADLFMKN